MTAPIDTKALRKLVEDDVNPGKGAFASLLDELDAIYDAHGCEGADRCVDGVKGSILLDRNAIRLQKVNVEKMRERKNGAYTERNRCVALLARMALTLGWRAGRSRTAIPGWAEDWHGVVCIDLPTGQVSWHFHDSHAPFFASLPAYDLQWDGHDTDEKYRRVQRAVEGV